MNVEETSAIVTGAASGLGRAVAQRLADAGATFVGLDLAAALEAVDTLAGSGSVDAPKSRRRAHGLRCSADQLSHVAPKLSHPNVKINPRQA
jgi:NAD(P)-dependent dehydrogenase (short-subunit alcohol dehydrogenase family)